MNRIINFNSSINIDSSQIIFDEIEYKKSKNTSSNIKLNGLYIKNKGINFNKINFTENKNKILASNLNLSENSAIFEDKLIITNEYF